MHHAARYGTVALLAMALFLGWEIRSGFRQEVQVVFLDVGQGDAILLSQGTHQVLIDGGKSGKVLLERLGQHMPFWDRDIDAVLLTHPDEDHIGGIADTMDRYTVHAVLKTDAQGFSQTFQRLEQTLRERNIPTVSTYRGLKVNFPDASLETIFPVDTTFATTIKNTNDASIVTRFTAARTKFLLTGDLPSEYEDRLNAGKIDVLKVGHHGSKYSTSESLLEATTPQEAVVSVGAKNSYGHPAPDVLKRLQNHQIKVWRTDQSGSIVYTCSPNDAGGCIARTKK